MKKSILLILLSVAITASAVTFMATRKSKVPPVSENINIPHFIDTLMSSERMRIFNRVENKRSKESRLANLGFPGKIESGITDTFAVGIKTLFLAYDSLYPQNQFINYRCLNAILEKYGLSWGTTDSYIGDVPDYAVNDMEKFHPTWMFSRWGVSSEGRNTMWEAVTPISEVSKWHGGYGGIDTYMNDSYNWITSGNGKLGAEKNLIKYALIDKEKRVGQKSFLIVAPKHLFKGNENNNGGFGVLDPIVLYPVDGGYIIVTAW